MVLKVARSTTKSLLARVYSIKAHLPIEPSDLELLEKFKLENEDLRPKEKRTLTGVISAKSLNEGMIFTFTHPVQAEVFLLDLEEASRAALAYIVIAKKFENSLTSEILIEEDVAEA